MSRELTRDEAAAMAGVRPDTFSGYVSRGQAPAPKRRVSRTPVWDAAEVEAWAKGRPGRGARGTDRALKRAAERAVSEEDRPEA